MKRAAAAIVLTIAGLVILLGFKTGRPTPASLGSPGTAPTTGSSSPAGLTGTSRTVTGRVVQTPFGSVQIRVTSEGRHITNVTAVQLPSDTAYSRLLSQSAGPQLRQEALIAQSARIDGVSGATYTSNGYAQSLQSALDRLQG